MKNQQNMTTSTTKFSLKNKWGKIRHPPLINEKKKQNTNKRKHL